MHRGPNPQWLAALALAAALAATVPARAHDSWLAPLGGDGRWLALGTGSRFPAQEVAIDPRYLARSGCRGPAGELSELKPRTLAPHALLLQVASGAATCWAQLQAFEIELKADVIDLYFAEAQPEPAVRERWAALQARGKPWLERYTKHARVILDAGAIDAAVAGSRDAASHEGPTLDLRLESPDPVDGGLPRAGSRLTFRLLDGGRALTGQALELVGSTGTAGSWTRTDAEGRVQIVVPGAGRWLLRGIEIKPAEDRPDAWTSRFVTLAFSVRPPAPGAFRTASP